MRRLFVIFFQVHGSVLELDTQTPNRTYMSVIETKTQLSVSRPSLSPSLATGTAE